MQRSKNDVWVGLFVLIGLVAILFLALKSANLLQFNLASDYIVSAKFENIGGLKKGAAVKSAGVVVGRVDAIQFDDESYQARVHLALQTRVGKVERGALQVFTSSKIVLTELEFMKPQLLKSIQKSLPDFSIRSLKFRCDGHR